MSVCVGFATSHLHQVSDMRGTSSPPRDASVDVCATKIN
jgi:hypothetical protein